MRQRLKLKSVKGYLQIDIAFAILVFFLLFLTIFTLNKESINSKTNLMVSKELEMNARDICSMLISSPGVPRDWEDAASINDTKVFGLKSSSVNGLDSDKITHFNSTNYFTIRNRVDSGSYFNVKIVGLNSSSDYLDFGTSLSGKNVKSSSYNCYSVYNSEIVKVIVEVWK